MQRFYTLKCAFVDRTNRYLVDFNTFSPVIGTTANISIRQTVAIQKYYIKITAQGCEAIDSIVAVYNDTIPQISLADNLLQCSNQVALNASVNYNDNIT